MEFAHIKANTVASVRRPGGAPGGAREPARPARGMKPGVTVEFARIKANTIASSKFNFRRILVFDNYRSRPIELELYE